MSTRRKITAAFIHGTAEVVATKNPLLPTPDAAFIFLERIREIKKKDGIIVPSIGEPLFRIRTLSRYWDIPRPTLMDEVKAGRLHTIKIKGRLHVSVSDAKEWMRKAIQERGEGNRGPSRVQQDRNDGRSETAKPTAGQRDSQGEEERINRQSKRVEAR